MQNNKSSSTYRHGGNPAYDFKRFGIPEQAVIDFSVNTSPYGPPAGIKEIWHSLFEEIKHYPDLIGEGVKTFYRQKFGLQPGQILPGNGASEVIYLAFQALAPRKVLIIIPSFHDYFGAAALNRAEITALPLSADENFRMPAMGAIEQKLDKADALVLGNPNNPTGTMIDRDSLLGLANKYQTKWFLVDEAFIQFVDDFRQQSLLFTPLPVNVLVFHSLTKFYTLPGLRLGSVIGHADTIARLLAYKIPWSVNRLAEKIAPMLANCEHYEKSVIKEVAGERQRLYNSLNTIRGIKVFPARANFMLAQWTATKNLDDLIKPLLTDGLYLRDCRNFPGLEENFFRFAILTPENNDRLIENLIRICSKFT